MAISSAERLRLIARRRPSASDWEKPAREVGYFQDLLLEDDRSKGAFQRCFEQRVFVGDFVVGVFAQPLAAFDVGMDGAALDRARAHQRHLHGEVLEVARLSLRQHLHLRPGLDLKDAGGLRGSNRFEGLLVFERYPRKVDALSSNSIDLLNRAIDRREHSQAEQVNLQ